MKVISAPSLSVEKRVFARLLVRILDTFQPKVLLPQLQMPQKNALEEMYVEFTVEIAEFFISY